MAKKHTMVVRNGPGAADLRVGEVTPHGIELMREQDQPLPVDGATDPAELPEAPPPDQELERVLGELGDDGRGARVIVYRYRPDIRREAYLFECLPQEFAQRDIADRYGSGDYMVRVMLDGQLLTRRKLLIETPAKAEGALLIDPSLKAILEAQQKTLDALVTKVNAPPAVQPIDQLLNGLKVLDDLRGGNRAPASDPYTMLERAAGIMGKLKAAADGNPVGAGTNDILLEVVRAFVPAIAEGMKKLPAGALPANVRSIESAPSIQTSAEDEMSLIVLGTVKLLVRAAVANDAIDGIAQRVANETPEELLTQFLDNPDWLNMLAGYDERVRLYQPWFEKLRAKVMELTAQSPAA
jgi:hypothetical protein